MVEEGLIVCSRWGGVDWSEDFKTFQHRRSEENQQELTTQRVVFTSRKMTKLNIKLQTGKAV